MTSLRSLLSSIKLPDYGNPTSTIYVFRDTETQNHGGRCCLWTVPEGITRATFEIWGAGAPGQGARCCERASIMPSSGSYAVKTIDVTSGTNITICAGGNGCCGYCCGIGYDGEDSFVLCSGTLVACANGGAAGCSQNTRASIGDGYTCCYAKNNNNGCGSGDVAFPGYHGQYHHNRFCCQTFMMYSSGGVSSSRIMHDVCAGSPAHSGCSRSCSPASWPAGAGLPATACGGGYCFGQSAGSGLVIVKFS